MFSWGAPGVGDVEHNHWAVGGCLEKCDRELGSSAQAWQKQNRYRSTVNAAGTALHIGGRWDSFNAGHCNQDAMRSAFFEEPRFSVTRRVDPGWRQSRMYAAGSIPVVGRLAFGADAVLGAVPGVRRLARDPAVEYTPHDIRGLMVLCMDDLVDPSKGSGGFEYVGFRYQGPVATGLSVPQNHDINEPYPHDVITRVCQEWGQNRRLGIIVEKKPGQTLDNRLYDAGKVDQLRFPPPGFDHGSVPADGQVKFFHLHFNRVNEPISDVHMDCWVHTADNGSVTSGWIFPPSRGRVLEPLHDAAALAGVIRKDSANPDFFWIAHLQPEILNGAPWIGFAEKTNPNIDMFQVWTLYMDSVGKDWKAVAQQYPERIAAHMAAVEKKTATRGKDWFKELGIQKPPT
jgi:hypothetical protein